MNLETHAAARDTRQHRAVRARRADRSATCAACRTDRPMRELDSNPYYQVGPICADREACYLRAASDTATDDACKHDSYLKGA